MASIPTIHLQSLFGDLDFLSGAKDGQKPCFRSRCYVDRTSWMGSGFRLIQGESQSSFGNTEIDTICKNASETYGTYHSDTRFGKILLDKIVAARQGLLKIAKTYEAIGKDTEARNIRNSGILILDAIIPEDRKLKEDIILTRVDEDNNVPTQKECQRKHSGDSIYTQNFEEES